MAKKKKIKKKVERKRLPKTITMVEGVWQELDRYCEANDKVKSRVIETAIRQYLKKENWQLTSH